MEILYIIMPISILLGSFFLAAFILASKKEQFEDMETPAMRMLLEDDLENVKGKDFRDYERNEDKQP